jgi:ATP-binding cassette, subfamily B, bacterial PglK
MPHQPHRGEGKAVLQQYRQLLAIMSASTRRNLLIAVLGSLVVAGAEVIGVGAVLPLMQIMTGVPIENSGPLTVLADLVGTNNSRLLSIWVAAIAFFAFLFKGVVSIAFRWWMLGFLYREEANTSTQLLRYYLDAPYALHLKHHSGELLRVMNESVGLVYSLVVVAMVSAITDALSIVFIIGTLFVLKPLATAAAAAYFAAGALFYLWLIRGRAERYGELMNSAGLRIHKAGVHALGGIKEIKIRHHAQHFLDSYLAARTSYAVARRKASFINEVPKFLLEILFILGIGILAVAILQSQAPAEALSLLALFVAAGFRALPSLVRMLASLNSTRVGQPLISLLINDVQEMNAFYAANPGPAQPAPPLRLREGIVVKELAFRYPDSERNIINELNLSVPAGTSLALVGSSGAGKSTLVDLLLGLHSPTRGQILVDNLPISRQLPAWQSSIGMVPQDVYLLDESVRANIIFGQPHEKYDETALHAAIERAELTELIAELPQGLDTWVGERGVRLSGGQRQRIGIARALYHQPAVLFLDEATSALDNETERKIATTINSLHGTMTIIVVAHRLSTVRHCDQLLFLGPGKVLAQGTFDEVVATNPEFARMVKLGSLEVPTR